MEQSIKAINELVKEESLFLELAGRNGCVMVGDTQGAVRLGESFREEQLFGLYRRIVGRIRKHGR